MAQVDARDTIRTSSTIIQDMTSIMGTSCPGRRVATCAAIAASLLGTAAIHADSIFVPNGSFESQSGVGQPFGVNLNIDSWERPPNPGIPEGGPNGFYWVQSAGVFVGTAPSSPNPYSNLDGTQAAYILSIPGAGLYQDNQSIDWTGGMTGLHATYNVGASYQFTLGVFGKGMIDGYSTLQLSLYYRDGLGNRVNIGSTPIVFSSTTFNPAGPFTLVDYSVNLPTVQVGDAWANQNIGIGIDSTLGDGNGYWDMDNVRLTLVPEPSTLALAGLGMAGFAITSWRARRRA
jgi:hypothetical protein